MHLCKRKKVSFFLSLLVFFSLYFLACFRTDGFVEGKMYRCGSSWESPDSYQPALLENELQAIFSGPFFYLGRGRQSYAFESQDKKYVLKFFNFKDHRKPCFFSYIPLPAWAAHIFDRKQKRAKAFFQGYALAASQKNKEGKAFDILQVHLSSQKEGSYEFLLYDKWGQLHRISSQETAFVLQRKAEAFLPWLEASSCQEELFQKRLCQYLDLLFFRLKKKILDPDGRILSQVGVVEGDLVFFDSGRIFYEEALGSFSFFKERVEKETRQMKKWLLHHHPERVSFFEKELQKRLRICEEIS